MKITLDTSKLAAELFKLLGIVNHKSTLAVLQNALIEADSSGTIRFYATDLDLGVTTSTTGDVEQPGSISVRARDLYDAVKNLRSPSVTLEKEDNLWVRMTAGTVKARFVGMDPAEFPQRMSSEGISFFTIDTGKLIRMVDRTLFSTSTDESRPNLNGALFVAEGAKFQMVSTDGHRLSLASVETDILSPPPRLVEGVIVPRKGLHELRRTVDLTREKISVGLASSNIVFQQENTELFVRLIDGTFPKYREVFPQELEERRALIDREELIGRFKHASLFANSKTNNVALSFEPGVCTITSHDPDKGEFTDQIPMNYSGAVVKAGFNYKYVLDIIGVLDTQEVSVEIADSTSPTVVREVGNDTDEESIFIVMPMRL